MITQFDQVLEAVAERRTFTVAVAVAETISVMQAVKDAVDRDIVWPLLVGDRTKIEALAGEVGMDLTDVSIVHEPDDLKAARAAALAVRDGHAQMLMKGHIHTDDFLRAILDKETGLRSGYVMSQVFILETLDRGRLTFITDGAMNIAPDLTVKADIIMNAVYLARCFGIACPNVGVLAAVEVVNPRMPATTDAAALSVMARRGQFPDCVVDGPFALDNAVCTLAAEVKGIAGDVAGNCDILVVPNIEAGNILAKSFSFLAHKPVAGVLVGAAAPVVLTSRADNAEARLHSLAVAVLMSNIQRDDRLKIGKVHF